MGGEITRQIQNHQYNKGDSMEEGNGDSIEDEKEYGQIHNHKYNTCDSME